MERRTLLLGLGPLAALGVGLLALPIGGPAAWTAGITTLCALWWVTEPVPVPVTSLLPLAALPLLGVLPEEEVAASYGHPLILLLLGGFLLSQAMESTGVHGRLAIGLLRLIGGGGRRLLFGLMLASGLSSMWLSNTATVLVMLPVVLALGGARPAPSAGGAPTRVDPSGADPRSTEPTRTVEDNVMEALLIGLAWSASIGGLATPIGTPPNLIYLAALTEQTGAAPDFWGWARVGMPVVATALPAAWWLLARGLPAGLPAPALPRSGPWRPAERRVLAVFLLTALAWSTRTAPFGGWSQALGLSGAGETTVALVASLAVLLLPDGEGGGERLLPWRRAEAVPWGLLLLFAGGIALAKAFSATGLSLALGGAVAGLVGPGGLPLWAVVVGISVFVTFLTEVTSNTATATLLMPLLGAVALGAGLEPAQLMLPAAISASCAFMLPVATAPNAVVFGTGRVRAARMARLGLQLNLIGAALISGWVLLLA